MNAHLNARASSIFNQSPSFPKHTQKKEVFKRRERLREMMKVRRICVKKRYFSKSTCILDILCFEMGSFSASIF